MSWHFQAMRGEYRLITVREVFLREGKVESWSEEPVAPCCETKEELLEILGMMLKDCAKREVLEEKELEMKI